MNIAQALEQARDRDAHQLALIFGALRLTYAELDEQSNRVANSLRQVGVGRGDRVGLFLPNCPEWVMCYHGVQKIGAIAVSLSAALQREEVGFMLRDSGAQALVTTADLRGRVPVAEVPELRCIFVVGEATGADVALAAMMAQASPEAQAVALDRNDPAAIVYTSGTTGRPKGATLSHGNVLSNIAAKRHYLGIQPQDRLLLFMPLHHCFGQNAILNSGLGAGATVVLHPAFDGKRVLQSIVEDGVTMFFGIPTIFQFLLENATPHAMRSVRYYFCAAASLPVEIEKRWFETFHAVIYQGYGLTETSPFASYNHHRQHRMGSIGTPIEHVDMRIVDVETGCPLGPDERGEIAIRGPNVMLGYWNCPVETAEVIRDGWFHTGDIGRMDAEGYFYIEDRLKDMINVGGLKVYPAEVENVMYQHPAVAEVAVFGAPDSVLGEQVCAHVVLKSDQPVSTQQLLVFCRQQMAAFKVPSRVALVETLPKTPTGKVLKRVLREGAARQAADEMSRPKVSTTPAHDGVTRRTASSIRQWVEDWLVQHTQGDRSAIDLAQTFADYGLDSIAAVGFVREVGGWLGRELEATLAWNFPTIEAFVAHLVALEGLPASTAQTRQPPTHAAPRAPKVHTDYRPLVEKALVELRQRREALQALEQANAEPIAIVGMGCRFPSGIDDPDAYWHFLRQGGDAVREVPLERWDLEAYYDPDPEAPGKMYTRHGCFLDDVEGFDPTFFGISPREAVSLDPQQRLLLEVAWEALEAAGQSPAQLEGSAAGVFIGLFANDYAQRHFYSGDPTRINAYNCMSSLRSMAAGRLAYALGLQGPVMQLDTACSSSLLAVHLACQSLRSRECHLALAGGVNLILAPEATIGACKMKVASAQGRCKTFDAAADGFVRGEGCGVIVLKRLSDAMAHGDHILAVVRGSAVNHDGQSNGLTAPNGMAQQAVIRQALEHAHVSPEQIQYVEVHGTGTLIGDSIEVAALAAVLGQNRGPEAPLALGSVKTNFGHQEGAAGIASLMKTVLALQHETLPPHLHFHAPNPYVPWDKLPVWVPTQAVRWPSHEAGRLAGVSAFGISGTNVHVVVAQAPEAIGEADLAPDRVEVGERPQHLVSLSAKDPRALAALVSRYERFLASCPQVDMADIGFTANCGRSHFSHRLAFISASIDQLRDQLRAFMAGSSETGCVQGQASGHQRPTIAFLFPGQVERYVGMGRQLYETQPTFRRALERCDAILSPEGQPGILDCLFSAAGNESSHSLWVALAEPALFAIEYALSQLWDAWGIKPDTVMGHGVGEYVAACVAGVFRVEDALKLVAARARLTQGESTLSEFENVANRVSLTSPDISIISSMSGERVDDAIAMPSYWVRQAQQPVALIAGMVSLPLLEHDVFVDLGPQPVLLELGRSCAPPGTGMWLPSLCQGQDDWSTLLQSLGELYCCGAPVDWAGFDRDDARRRLPLPTYPFQRQRYWLDAPDRTNRVVSPLGLDRYPANPHPLLGRRLHVAATSDIRFESSLRRDRPAFLAHHCIDQTPILPAAAYVEMALAAGVDLWHAAPLIVEDVKIAQALALPDNSGQPVQLVWRSEGLVAASFDIFSLCADEVSAEPSWTLHASGRMRMGQAAFSQIELSAFPPPGAARRSIADHYAECRERGMVYGASFQAIEQLWCDGDRVFARVQLPQSVALEGHGYRLHPVLFDACLQALGAGLTPRGYRDIYLPVAFDRLSVYGDPGDTLWVEGQLRAALNPQPSAAVADMRMYDASGALVARLEGLTLQRTRRDVLRRTRVGDIDNWLYDIDWQPCERRVSTLATAPEGPGRWLIFMDRDGLGDQLVSLLQAHGAACVRVSPGSAYERVASSHYQVNPDLPEDFQRLLQDSSREGMSPYRSIVFLWGLLAPRLPDHPHLTTSLADMQTFGCRSALHVVQACARSSLNVYPRLWLVTSGGQPVGPPPHQVDAAQAPLWGLGRVIAIEHAELQCRRVDLEPSAIAPSASRLFAELWQPERDDEIAFRQEQRYVARLTRYRAEEPGGEPQLDVPQGTPSSLQLSGHKTLGNLSLQPMTRREPAPDEVEIQVHASGLNFRDVLHAIGMLPWPTSTMHFGFECSGRIAKVGRDVTRFEVGDPVVGSFIRQSMSTFVTVPAAYVVPRPDGLSDVEAATIPVAFMTAYYGLEHLAKMAPGARVLIHAAAGGVGMAAVQLAQRAGAEVFATASPRKWPFLKSIGVQHVMHSRTLDFADEIMALTHGQGVDIALNSLNGDYIPKTLQVLAAGGRLVEIGKLGIWEPEQVAARRPDVTYLPLDIGEVSQRHRDIVAPMLSELLRDFSRGRLQPLPHKVFPIQQAERAFRYMAQAQHIGKIVVSQEALLGEVNGVRRGVVRDAASYLVTGGLGALGLKVAQWLVDQGARHVVLVGRRGASSEAQAAIRQLERCGAHIHVWQADVSKSVDVASLLQEIQTAMPLLRGIVHAAGTLDDGVLLQQDVERFDRVMAPKIMGAWNLHVLTRGIHLDFMIFFSSAAALLGAAGQGNYAAANAFLDALAHYRRGLGLPGLSINWGPWAEGGMAAGLPQRHQYRFAMQGIKPLTSEQGLAILEQALEREAVQVGAISVNWATCLQGLERYRQWPFLERLRPSDALPAEPLPTWRHQLEAAAASERRTLLVAHIRTAVASVLGFHAVAPIDTRQALSTLGIDSLMAVDLKNRLEFSVGCALRPTLVFDYPTVEAMADYILHQVLYVEDTREARPQRHGGETRFSGVQATKLEELPEAEAEAMLLDELDKLNY